MEPNCVTYRDVPGFPGYRVGDDGSVRSCWRRGGGSRVMTDSWHQVGHVGANGYRYVWLIRPGVRRNVQVHTIVLTAFTGPRPAGKECRHLDGNRLNCARSNLEWGTPTENQDDRARHGTDNRGERHGLAVLDTETVFLARYLYEVGGMTQQAIADHLRLKRRTVGRAITGDSWQHLGLPRLSSVRRKKLADGVQLRAG